MTIDYGVLRGRVQQIEREDDLDRPHLQVIVTDQSGARWRVPVNVLSADGSFLIYHRVDLLQSHPVLAGLGETPSGFTPIAPALRSATTALDYFRAPLFDWPTGVAIRSTAPGADDDLQDALTAQLRDLQRQNGEVFVFGEPFPKPGQPDDRRPVDRRLGTRQGVHNIHMNQGNPNPGSFAGDNGVFQDGGLILRFPNRYVGLFLRFRSQWLPTDNATGHPLPGAHEIPPGGAPVTPAPVAEPAVYIERALVNPAGADPGREVVVLGNATTAAVDLTGWSIVDRNDNAEFLGTLHLPGGESLRIVLSGTGAQLGNQGGTIRLCNRSGVQIHAVSYSREDAQLGDRYIRFTT